MSEPVMDEFGRKFIHLARDRAIQGVEVAVSPRSKAVGSAAIQELLSTFNTEQLDALHQLIPKFVDTTLHYVLWTFEEWEAVQIGIRGEHGTVPDLRSVALGELQGYLYDWIPRFSAERRGLTP